MVDEPRKQIPVTPRIFISMGMKENRKHKIGYGNTDDEYQAWQEHFILQQGPHGNVKINSLDESFSQNQRHRQCNCDKRNFKDHLPQMT